MLCIFMVRFVFVHQEMMKVTWQLEQRGCTEGVHQVLSNCQWGKAQRMDRTEARRKDVGLIY